MQYNEAKIENGRIVITHSQKVNQSELTSDCWLIQIKGLEACKTCEVKGTKECGGKNIIKKLKNM